MASFINGNQKADQILEELKLDIANLGFSPRLAIFLASNDHAIQVFTQLKLKRAEEIGIDARLYEFQESISKEDLLQEITRLKNNVGVHGALLQLPLFEHLKSYTNELLNALTPEKDADGLTALNQGKLSFFLADAILPAAVEAILECLNICKEEDFTWKAITESSFKIKSLMGQNIVIINNSNLIGKPLSQILTSLGGTVTVAHEYTNNLVEYTQKADILVSATGKTDLIGHSMIKENAILIDVTSVKVGDNYKGDFIRSEKLDNKAAWISPVPGGIGPLAIACLLRNVVKLAAKNH